MNSELFPPALATQEAKKKWFRFIISVTLVTTFISVMLVHSYTELRKLMHQETRLYLDFNTAVIKDSIADHLNAIEAIAHDLATDIKASTLEPDAIQKILENTGAIHDGFVAIGAAFEPYALDDRLRLFAPYIVHHEGGYRTERLDAWYDYFAQEADGRCVTNNWYQCAKQKEQGWLPLRFDEISNAWIVQFVQAIRVEEQLLGYVNVSLNIKDVDQLINKLDTGDEGYVIIFDRQKRQIYHSLHPNTRDANDIYFADVFPELNPDNLYDLPASEQMVIPNEVTQVPSFLDLALIVNTDWTIAVIIEREFFGHHELQTDVSPLASLLENNHHILTFMIVLTAICWTALGSSLVQDGFHGRVWWSALFITLTFVGGIVYIWVEQQVTDLDAIYGTEVITNKADLRTFVKDYSKNTLRSHKEPPIFVPTGVALQSMKMDSENNLKLTGYIWQRFMLANNYEIEKGVVFPESSETNIRLVYDEVANGYQTLGWAFETVIPEHFEYETYPFDKQLVWLRIWPKEYLEHVVLLPDLESYDNMNTSNRPGLEQDFSVGGWRVERSFFDIRENSFNSNMGIANRANKNQAPELHFNIAISRNFIDPFVSYLFPVIIVLLMLYAVLLTNSKDENRIGLIGFNALEVLASASALFFVALLAHVELRSHIGANELIYMEYFFIIAYIMILIVSVNSILFSWGFNITMIQYQDNNIPKLLYWPVLGGLLFFFTMFAFW
ncbi:cache domain-containing protein [Planctobacterium marinum]|uniref:Cache domain-containing protein n=1 Tax=Planctobacterium marinum TaxID=1631968 RepID=A0AA48KP01_9ALTE|nr:hypothetical protein MACH26_04290 [Planctobacterium marinum]